MTRETLARIMRECVFDIDGILQELVHKASTEPQPDQMDPAVLKQKWNPAILTKELFKIRVQEEWTAEAEKSWERGDTTDDTRK